jgi:hypothetical protein
MLARAARLVCLSDAPDLLEMGDELFLVRLKERAQKLGTEGAERIVDCLRSRKLYKRIHKVGRMSRDAWDEARESGAFCDHWRDGKTAEQMLSEVKMLTSCRTDRWRYGAQKGKAGMKLARAHVVWDSAEKGLQGPWPLGDDKVTAQFPGVGETG